jgi:hypothetical protein
MRVTYCNQGHIQTMNAEQIMQQLFDEAAIRSIVDGISRTVDAKDWQACRDFFLEQITVDFTSLAGGSPADMKADDLVFNGWAVNLYADKISHHMHTGHLISISGDRATCFSKGQAWNRLNRGLGSDLWEVWGDYIHTFQRAEAGWKCSGLTFKAVHARGNEKVRDYIPEN